MDATQIEGLIALFERSTLTELEYTEADSRLHLVRGKPVAPAASPTVPAPVCTVLAEPAPAPARSDMVAPQQWKIVAGLTGTFFTSPAPDEPAFINIGESIREGQTVGIIEAMKMLNSVESDRDARVVSIEVENGSLVEAGTVLVVLEPIASANV